MTPKEKALDKYIREKHNQDECVGFIDGYEKCQEDMADKWISVNNKPTQKQYVLVYGKGDRQMTAIYQDNDFYCYDLTTEWLEIAEEITHWMPLPNKPLNKQD